MVVNVQNDTFFYIDFQAEILAKLLDINENLLELLRRTAPSNNNQCEVDDNFARPRLPVENVLELDKLNEWLSDEQSKSRLVR